MDKSRILKTFNNHFEEFLEDILRVFPDNKDIITCKQALMAMRKMNPIILISAYKQTVSDPYREQIVNNNIDFFIHKNYNDDIFFTADTSKTVLEKIDLLRKPVGDMCEEDKRCVAKYLNNLLKLCDLYNN